ncbi:hypothetical protein C6503_02640 [Candidatus Poribacteria bacterium]|nr:MAG: hypothetical protein C6503_02640 [Candidatus Poribacteria bacterium]
MKGKEKLKMRVCQTHFAIGMTFVLTCLMTTTALAQGQKLDYIGGPWLYAAIPCDGIPCDDVGALETDFLSRFTGKLVLENEIAQGIVKPKDILFLGGRLTWQTGFLGGREPIFTDNIGTLVDGADLNPAGYSNAVFYGLIVLDVDKKSSGARVHLDYTAYAKIWLNGKVIYESEQRNWDEAENMTTSFVVPLERGKNLLAAKVIEGIGWNLFVNINSNFKVSYRIRNGKIVRDNSLPVEPSPSTVVTRWAALKTENHLIQRNRN